MDQKKIGAYIAQKRHEKGLTQKSLAEKLYVSDKAVSKWERGICLPDLSCLLSLSEIFGVSVEDVLHGQDPTTIQEEGDLLIDAAISYSDETKNRLIRKSLILGCVIAIALSIIFFAYSHFNSSRYDPEAASAALELDSTTIEIYDLANFIKDSDYQIDKLAYGDMKMLINEEYNKWSAFYVLTEKGEEVHSLLEELDDLLFNGLSKIETNAFIYYNNGGEEPYFCTEDEKLIINDILKKLPDILQSIRGEMGINTPKI